MVFKFQKIIFLEFRVARVSKKRPGSVRVFKNTRTAGQISGRVWTRPSPKTISKSKTTSVILPISYIQSRQTSYTLNANDVVLLWSTFRYNWPYSSCIHLLHGTVGKTGFKSNSFFTGLVIYITQHGYKTMQHSKGKNQHSNLPLFEPLYPKVHMLHIHSHLGHVHLPYSFNMCFGNGIVMEKIETVSDNNGVKFEPTLELNSPAMLPFFNTKMF